MAQKTVTNSADFMSMVNENIIAAMTSVGQAVYEELKKNTSEAIYSDVPVLYKRTYELYNSISQDLTWKDSNALVSVFFDENKIQPSKGYFKRYGSTIFYGRHANNKGKSVKKKIVMYLEDGISGSTPYAYTTSMKKGGLHMYNQRDGGHMIRDTQKWVIENVDLEFANAFSSLANNRINVMNM